MAYDMRGAWDPMTGHNSPLYGSAADKGQLIYFNVVSKTRYKGKHLIATIRGETHES